jgi:hypothetical protein
LGRVLNQEPKVLCFNRDLNPHKSRSQNIVIYLLLESRSWVTWSLDSGSRPQFGTLKRTWYETSTLRNPDPQSYILLQKRGPEEHHHVNTTRTEILKLLATW